MNPSSGGRAGLLAMALGIVAFLQAMLLQATFLPAPVSFYIHSSEAVQRTFRTVQQCLLHGSAFAGVCTLYYIHRALTSEKAFLKQACIGGIFCSVAIGQWLVFVIAYVYNRS